MNKKRLTVAFSGPSNSGKTTAIVKVARILQDNTYDIKYYDKENAQMVELKPYDTVTIGNLMTNDFPKITIKGGVINPGTFNFSSGLTLKDVINNLGGGLKQNAEEGLFELVSYYVENGVRRINRF